MYRTMTARFLSNAKTGCDDVVKSKTGTESPDCERGRLLHRCVNDVADPKLTSLVSLDTSVGPKL